MRVPPRYVLGGYIVDARGRGFYAFARGGRGGWSDDHHPPPMIAAGGGASRRGGGGRTGGATSTPPLSQPLGGGWAADEPVGGRPARGAPAVATASTPLVQLWQRGRVRHGGRGQTPTHGDALRDHPPPPPLRAFWATDAIAITPCRRPPHTHPWARCRGASANTTRLHTRSSLPPPACPLIPISRRDPARPPTAVSFTRQRRTATWPYDPLRRDGSIVPLPPPPLPALSSSPPPLRSLPGLCTSFLYFPSSPPTP